MNKNKLSHKNFSENESVLPVKEFAIAASVRAVSGKKDIKVKFSKSNIRGYDRQSQKITLPKLKEEHNNFEFNTLRGIADSSALKIKYHNTDLHLHKLPTNKQNREIFESAEIARVESIGVNEMPGIAKNIDAKITNELLNKGLYASENITTPPTKEIVALTIRKYLTNRTLPEIAHGVMTKFGTEIKKAIKPYKLQLSENIENQEAFADTVAEIIESLNTDYMPNSKKQTHETTKQKEKTADSRALEEKENAEFGDELKEVMNNINAPKPEKETQNISKTKIKSRTSNSREVRDSQYHIFTTEFDEVIDAEKLCTNSELIKLREELDSKLLALEKTTKRYVNIFLRKLLSHRTSVWDYNKEDGIIDAAKFASLIANPTYTEYYKSEQEAENSNTIVTLLLDNSGSMRGKPIHVAAMCAEILAKLLETCGIKVEILGFTTKEWKGGKSRKKWIEQGSPEKPGRLNDIRHIIYKPAHLPWRQSKKNLGVMLKEGILKENIDGEAIRWATQRLLSYNEKRKILMIISDGAPVDDSSISNNSTYFLEDNLRNVINMVQTQTSIELIAIGIGHDVTEYYQHAVKIDNVKQLGNTIFKELTALFEQKESSN